MYDSLTVKKQAALLLFRFKKQLARIFAINLQRFVKITFLLACLYDHSHFLERHDEVRIVAELSKRTLPNNIEAVLFDK